jgi:hypothetical protein
MLLREGLTRKAHSTESGAVRYEDLQRKPDPKGHAQMVYDLILLTP